MRSGNDRFHRTLKDGGKRQGYPHILARLIYNAVRREMSSGNTMTPSRVRGPTMNVGFSDVFPKQNAQWNDIKKGYEKTVNETSFDSILIVCKTRLTQHAHGLQCMDKGLTVYPRLFYYMQQMGR